MAISNIYIYEDPAQQKAQHRAHQKHSVEWKLTNMFRLKHCAFHLEHLFQSTVA